jgi:hypothetical protein
MAGKVTLAEALQRLESAVAALDNAVDHHGEAVVRRDDVDVEMQRLESDRSRLAQALDTAQAKSVTLEETGREVSRRLVGAMESIRAIIARHEGG